MNTISGLYPIYNHSTTSIDLTQLEAILAAGCCLFQYRNKTPQQMLSQIKALQTLCQRYHTPLIINDDIALAQALQADGVHLGQQDGSIKKARQALGKQAIIGITCHNSLELAQQAEQAGADYLALGRFFPSQTKPNSPSASLDDLRRIRPQVSCSVIAIGGITPHNGKVLLQAGADSLAVIHGLFAAANPSQQAMAYNQLFLENS